MEETPKSEGVIPSKSGSAETKGVAPLDLRALLGNLPGSPHEHHYVDLVERIKERKNRPVQELENYKQLVARAVDVFGDEIKASKWLSLPNAELNGYTPLQIAQRDGYSGQVLEPVFTLIEHGIYY
jgi:hypothetical protein